MRRLDFDPLYAFHRETLHHRAGRARPRVARPGEAGGAARRRHARVRFTPDGGKPKDSIVRENFYEIRVPESAPPTRMRPPKDYKGPVGKDGMLEGPGGPAHGKLEWFDADGKPIKQHR